MFTYSVLEASEKLGISIRGVQKRCQRDDVRKKDNKFLITDSILEKWEKERHSNVTNVTKENVTRNVTQDLKKLTLENEDLKAEIQQNKTQLNLEVESLKTEIEDLKNKLSEKIKKIEDLNLELDDLVLELDDLEDEAATDLKTEDIQKLNLDDIENIDFKFQREGEFIKEGNFVFVPKDKVFAEYSQLEYSEAEQKLQEWSTMQTKITIDQEMFELKLSTANDFKDHYKSQFEYQKKQSEKMLDLHQKLIDTIASQNKLALQRNFIEAHDKGLDKK